MATSTAILPPARAAFGALIDYAGLFAPAELPLAAAVREYQAARAGPHAWMLGRFIVPAQLLDAAAATFDGPFSVIVEPTAGALAVARIRARVPAIEMLEIPLRTSVSPLRDRLSRDEILNVLGALEADLVVSGLRDLPVFMEIPRAAPWWSALSETVDAIARFGFAAKLRCGGITAAAFPSVEEVAAFIHSVRGASVAFKATAGLHHPVRHRDPATGFTMHGFLNLIAAAALVSRVEPDTLLRVIAEEDPKAFAFDDRSLMWRDLRVDVDQVANARRDVFVSYGSCSFAEPVEDLTTLGLLPIR
jgi:hypothetical protein